MAPQLLQEVRIPEQKLVNGGAPLPLVLAPAENEVVTVERMVGWVKQEKSWIEEQLLKSGAVLFRGCGLKTPEDFNTVVEAFDYEERSYIGGRAKRTHVVGRVYTANEAPAHVYIPFHHELAQSPGSPSKLFFFCELEPSKGGETPLLWSNSIVQRLQQECPDFLQQLEQKGLLYEVYLDDEENTNSYVVHSWKTLYNVNDTAEIEAKIAAQGHGLTRVEWADYHGVKLVTGPLPALKWDKQRQQNVFFNYMLHVTRNENGVPDKEVAALYNVTFGDGSPLPREQVLICERIVAEEKVEFKWQQGDLILIDNVAVQHSKNPCFSSRRILASLVV